ncbi:hypothetical protein LJC44_03590, partial [Parabacteroides sp. OttesenSCG-928-G06]|nr:hypothetical protein [Parabacteroides sp. OttesenSCG-928-G06]
KDIKEKQENRWMPFSSKRKILEGTTSQPERLLILVARCFKPPHGGEPKVALRRRKAMEGLPLL